MADVQSDNGWTKTELGNGWVKLTEVCDAFESGTTDHVLSTAVTNSTSSAVSGGSSMPVINELKAAGSFIIEVSYAAGTIQADTHLLMKNSAGTYQNLVGCNDLIVDQTGGTTAIGAYDGPISDGLKVQMEKDSGNSTAVATVSLIYYNGGPNQSDVTISGVGADPS
tara:strand:- start:9817 stop:10317 length:501 start_codon:yes stop_codon:yes gene_type:complete